jgi:hypothetical protein
MGQWRTMAVGFMALIPVAVYGAAETSVWVVLPPLVAAALVLLVAAAAVDYFGIARRRVGWSGVSADPRRAWMRARALEHRFDVQKRRGSPRTSWTARSLLVALAECDRLDEAGAVVDFLSADALTARVGADATADGLRAVALAETGRLDDARALIRALDGSRRARRQPITGYAAARVAELDRRPADALARADEALRRAPTAAARRDLDIVRARALVGLNRGPEAVAALGTLVAAGWRHEVEQLGDHARSRGQTALALACREALSAAAPYR